MDFQNECLRAHNEYRTKHGVPPLKLNRDMCKVSQDWANNLIKKGVLLHSNNRDYGENLFCIQSTNPQFTIDGKEAVKNWYDEIKCYKFGVEPSSLAAGHFTQVVWKESKELGVAFAKSGGKIVVVANYSPPGNIIGFFADNVPPPGGFRSNNNHIELSHNLSHLSLSTSKVSYKSTQNITEGNFEEDFLEAHNIYRRRHGVSPLKLDKKLCKYSEEWARYLAQRNMLEHRPGSNYGENIYCLYSSDPNFTVNGHTPVDTWYEEVVHHPFGKEPSSLKSGHFTQVIWKSSEFLGVGVAKNSQNSIYVVANYSPAGNFVGHYVENVPPVKPAFYGNVMAEGRVENKTNVSAGKFDQFCLDGLKVHNEYRRQHGVPDLQLSEKLCKFAQEWADNLAKTSTLQHRSKCPYGENIFSSYSSDYSHTPTARDAVKEWYDEIKEHIFFFEKVNQQTLHFTQVIWKNSKELGMGIAKNNEGQTYIVANYDPKGNFVGQFVENVPACHGNMVPEKKVESESSPVPAGNVEQFCLDALKIHNEYRRLHGVPDLQLNENLCKYAQEWADNLEKTSTLQHRSKCPYGENIFSFYCSDYSRTPTARDAVKEWYDEVQKHVFGVEKVNQQTLHFTQVIWKNSKELGMGIAKSKKGQTYIVANYDPKGNFVGQFVENVPPINGNMVPEKKVESETALEPSQSSPIPVGNFDQFCLDALKIHNEYRRRHGVPDLQLSEKLCTISQEWADTCAKTSSLQPRANCPYGENIFSVYCSDYSYTPTARDAVKEWYDEVKKHVFDVEKVNQQTLHFSQVIWKNSKELGIGIAKNKKGQTYIVANYEPRGNFVGQFVENVLKPKS